MLKKHSECTCYVYNMLFVRVICCIYGPLGNGLWDIMIEILGFRYCYNGKLCERESIPNAISVSSYNQILIRVLWMFSFYFEPRYVENQSYIFPSMCVSFSFKTIHEIPISHLHWKKERSIHLVKNRLPYQKYAGNNIHMTFMHRASPDIHMNLTRHYLHMQLLNMNNEFIMETSQYKKYVEALIIWNSSLLRAQLRCNSSLLRAQLRCNSCKIVRVK